MAPVGEPADMSLYSSASQPRGERSVRFDEDSSRLEESEEEEEIDTLMRELRDSAGESSEASQALLAMQAENRDQKKQINVLGLKLKHAELSQKIAEGKLQIAMEETERVVLQRDAALQQIQRLHAQPRSSEQDPRTPSGGSFDGAARGRGDPEYISKMEGDLRHSQEAVRGFREQLEQEQRQRGEAGGKVSQLLGINGHLKEQMEGHLTRAREAEKRMLAAEAFARGAGAEAEALVRGAREEAEASARAARDKGEGLARAAKESLEAARQRKTRERDVAFSQLTLVLAHLEDFQEEIQSMTEETHAAQRTTMRVGGASALPLLLGRLSRAARRNALRAWAEAAAARRRQRTAEALGRGRIDARVARQALERMHSTAARRRRETRGARTVVSRGLLRATAVAFAAWRRGTLRPGVMRAVC